MRSSPSSSGSSLGIGRSGLRLRKKHKRLDAICEQEYNRNHGEFNEDNGALDPDAGVRRSSRVRRAPVLLDASPPPPKKRRRSGKDEIGHGGESARSLWREDRGSGGTWSSRLRSRDRNVSFRVKEDRESPRGKRKLFEGVVERRGDEVDRKEELGGSRPKIVKSKRPGRIKATKHEDGHEENVSHVNLDEGKSQEVELVLNNGEEGVSVPETELSGGNRVDDLDGNAPVIGDEERNLSDNLQMEECDRVEPSPRSPVEVEHVDKEDERLESVKESGNGGDVAEQVDNNERSAVKEDDINESVLKDANIVRSVSGDVAEQVDNEGSIGKEVDVNENVLKDENIGRMDEVKHASNDKRGHQRIKEGRRCGLCGGGSDGKPPKRLVQDNGESENEAYSGSSTSEEPNYDIWDGFDDDPGWLGRLLGPINDHYGIARIWVHLHCAVWSPEVYFADFGCLKNVRAALFRGRALKCTRCGRRGATTGCRVDRCPRTYHLPCARATGCIFDHRKFLIACTDHRHLFQPRGNKYLARIKKLRTRKMMWELRKRSNDACRKDIGEEERWLENCGEDEEFLKRESKRLHRDLLRIAPVYIGGSDSANENSFQGWESVAGLKDVIRCMKEVVILPLLYPELFDNLGLTPPRGVLLHGHPGTGKTLVVRSLIGACARGEKRIAYFARKGADCLGKYVGDAERQLRLLFQVAEKCQPSIIFFDEIDGLAPVRTRQQDQTHSSVVSTLLALMDGLKSRGSVVVIGATNRPEAVDRALRRPGRFDREIYFPLPSIEDRASILSLHTQKWPKPITGSLLEWIARNTPGFAGADLQALCTQAAINALKRNFPLQEVLSLAEEKYFGCKHIPLPSFAVEERDWLEAFLSSPPPCSRRDAGNAANDVVCSTLPIQLIPCLLRPLCSLLVSLYLDERLWLPLSISTAVTMIKDVMVSALDKKKKPFDRWWLHMDDFLQETNIAYEVKRKLTCSGILSADDGFESSYDAVDDNKLKFESSIRNHPGMCSGLSSNMSLALTNKSGFRILISGNPRSGQRHLASCLLHCFVGNIEIQKIDMATISQEGHGDVVQGIAQILMKCASRKSCIVFMPRIDLWAVEKPFQIAEKTDSCLKMDKSRFTPNHVSKKENEINTEKKSTEMAEDQANQKASYAWMSFIEQVESIGVSTSLMILATSEVPYTELPHKIREFFKSYQSKDGQLTPLEQSVPRFSVQIDGNFDHDSVINLSAVELLRNVVEQQVQLIHQRSHVHKSVQNGHRTHESIEVCKDGTCQRKENGSANDKKCETQLEYFTKVPPPPNSKSLKGKSTLLLAISTFGYQILLYPHFAELCWVTSKLKEGPCADITGPWRGWPFNSCVIRPNNSHDKVVVSCSSGGIKSKERPGLVRGLIAVGLSAYRGVYKSVREVSLDVRKVLEILIEKINTKIQAGKDRYQYLRILSQVAYLEDMVNNWAYALLSLEQDTPEHKAKVMPANGGSLNSHQTCENHQTEIVPGDGGYLETLEGSGKGIHAETTGCLASNDNNDNLDNHDHDGENANSKGYYSLSDKHINSSAAAANQPPYPSTNQENGTLSGQPESVTTGNYEAVDGELGMSKELKKSTCTDSVVPSENGLHNATEPRNAQIGNFGTVSNQPHSLSTVEPSIISSEVQSDKHENAIDNNNVSPCKGIDPVESGVICLYQCCPSCLHSLYLLTKKMLVHEWRLNGGQWTVEDVHDAVASLSVDLISAVRKCVMAENEKHGTSIYCVNLRTCNPGNQGNDVVVAAECVSHSTNQHATAIKDDAVLNESPKLDLKFVFRDGVLVHMDPDKDVSIHCKFENLCLCSVRELIVMAKSSFD